MYQIILIPLQCCYVLEEWIDLFKCPCGDAHLLLFLTKYLKIWKEHLDECQICELWSLSSHALAVHLQTVVSLLHLKKIKIKDKIKQNVGKMGGFLFLTYAKTPVHKHLPPPPYCSTRAVLFYFILFYIFTSDFI